VWLLKKLSLKNLYYYYVTQRTCSREGHHRPMAREDSGNPCCLTRVITMLWKLLSFLLHLTLLVPDLLCNLKDTSSFKNVVKIFYFIHNIKKWCWMHLLTISHQGPVTHRALIINRESMAEGGRGQTVASNTCIKFPIWTFVLCYN
jgi:hypothetical protein